MKKIINNHLKLKRILRKTFSYLFLSYFIILICLTISEIKVHGNLFLIIYPSVLIISFFISIFYIEKKEMELNKKLQPYFNLINKILNEKTFFKSKEIRDLYFLNSEDLEILITTLKQKKVKNVKKKLRVNLIKYCKNELKKKNSFYKKKKERIIIWQHIKNIKS